MSLVACATTTRPPAPLTTATPAPAPTDAGAMNDAETAADEAGPEVIGTTDAGEMPASPCPRNMVLVASADTRFCIDVYEAALVEVDTDGKETPYPHWLPVDGHTVRAISEPDVFPQGFISEVQAEDACAASGKRLCTHPEWKTACMGPSKTTFPYGNTREAPGVCHDNGKSAVFAVFGTRAFTDPVARSTPAKKPAAGTKKGASSGRRTPTTKGRAAETAKSRATKPKSGAPRTPTKKASPAPAKKSTRPSSIESSVWAQLNDSRLGRVEGALSKTGTHPACKTAFGALDMVGNLHEWVKTDPSLDHGTFAGGYYLDTSLNGDGCNYRTTAHAHDYHDYSTGFRCCADADE